MARNTIHRIIVPVALAAVALAACGGDDDGSSSTAAPVATDAPAATEADDGYDRPAVTEAPAATAAPAATDAPAAGATLTIADFAFSDVTVAAGTPIALTNNDGFTHTVSDEGDAFDVSVNGGTTETLTIDEPGTYSIFCKIHTSMKGTIVVE